MKNTQQLTSSPVLAGGICPLTSFSSSRLFLKSSLFFDPAHLQIFFTYLKYSNSFVWIFQPGLTDDFEFRPSMYVSLPLEWFFSFDLVDIDFWVDAKVLEGKERRGFWVAIKTSKYSVSFVLLIINIYSGFGRRYVSSHAIFLPESNFHSSLFFFCPHVMIYYPSDLRYSNFLVWICMDGTTSSTFNRS
jgi:hypothetical protein